MITFICIRRPFVNLNIQNYTTRRNSKFYFHQARARKREINMSRIAIVTGSNRGIGYETVRALAKSESFQSVYLTAIDPDLGKRATEKLNSEENGDIIKFHQLDITCDQSISKFATFISENHGGFDVMVQNAGLGPDAVEPFHTQVEKIMKINFWGTLKMMKKFMPMARPNARIVLLSSMACWRAQLSFTPGSNPLAQEINLCNRSLTLERLEELAQKFVSDAKDAVF